MNNKQKIFGIGLSRTGTTSLHQALKLLGFKSKHFPFKLYFSLNDSLLAEYDAFTDSPVPLIYKDLDKMFPGSKFILTKRSLNNWLSSMKWMFEHGSVKWKWNNNIHKYHKELFGCDTFNKNLLENKYYSYHKEVKEYFENRNQDLLIMNIDKEANFEKLCSFLNLPIIKNDFPRSNKRTDVTFFDRLFYHYFIRNYQRLKNYL